MGPKSVPGTVGVIIGGDVSWTGCRSISGHHAHKLSHSHLEAIQSSQFIMWPYFGRWEEN